MHQRRLEFSEACASLSLLVPFVYALFRLSAYGYWMDAGEFVAQASELGISHPPGHPLYALLTYPFTLLPLGSIEWRVALASAVFGAWASLWLYQTLINVATQIHLANKPAVCISALALTLCVSLSSAWQWQMVRPEVYALQVALSLLAIERATRFLAIENKQSTPAYEPTLAMCVCLGFAATLHHLLAFICIAILLTLLYSIARPSIRRLGLYGAALIIPLITYAYLPLRTLAAGDQLKLGAPSTLARFVWVLSAKAFQKNTGEGVPQPFVERLADVFVTLIDNAGALIPSIALIAVYVGLRTKALRVQTALFALLLLVTCLVRAWLGFVRSNLDALGYLTPALVALVALFWIAYLLELSMFRAKTALWVAHLKIPLAIVAALILRAPFQAANLSTFSATDDIDNFRHRALPAHALLVLYTPDAVFRHFGAVASENTRPDIVLLPMPFLSYPGFVEQFKTQHPALAAQLWQTLRKSTLDPSEIMSLAHTRPVIVEPDLRFADSLLSHLIATGLLYELRGTAPSRADAQSAALQQSAAYAHLWSDENARSDKATRAVWLWSRYLDARVYASRGMQHEALNAVDAGLRIAPLDADLRYLKTTLSSQN